MLVYMLFQGERGGGEVGAGADADAGPARQGLRGSHLSRKFEESQGNEPHGRTSTAKNEPMQLSGGATCLAPLV